MSVGFKEGENPLLPKPGRSEERIKVTTPKTSSSSSIPQAPPLPIIPPTTPYIPPAPPLPTDPSESPTLSPSEKSKRNIKHGKEIPEHEKPKLKRIEEAHKRVQDIITEDRSRNFQPSKEILEQEKHKRKRIEAAHKQVQSKISASKSIENRDLIQKKEAQRCLLQMKYERVKKNFDRVLPPKKDFNLLSLGQEKTQNTVGWVGGVQFISKEAAEEICPDNEVDKVEQFYSKDEILSGLRKELAQLPNIVEGEPVDFFEDERLKLIELLKTITALPGQYITLDDKSLNIKPILEMIKKHIPSTDIDEQNIWKTIKFSIRRCEPYVLTSELMVKKLIDQNELNELNEERGFQEPKFVIKSGLENVREKLGAKLLATMGLSGPLVMKSDVSFREHEGLLASQFVDDNDPMIELDAIAIVRFRLNLAKKTLKAEKTKVVEMEKLWQASSEALNKAKKEHDQLIPKSDLEVAQIIVEKEKLAQKYSDALNDAMTKRDGLIATVKGLRKSLKVVSKGGNVKDCNLSDMHQLCMIDLLFQSTDSHSGQFLRTKDGHFHSFDFARFLPPNETFKWPSKEGIFADFRCCWLDYPSANQGLSKELQAKILDWDGEKLENQWREQGLIYSQKDYDRDKELLFELRSCIRTQPPSLDFILMDKDKYGLTKSDITALQTDPANFYTKHREKCFAKIGPKSLERFKARVTALQQYIKDCQGQQPPSSPTPRGAFAKMYPDFVPFLRAKDILDEGRGGNFFSGEQDVGPQSLDTIIVRARKHAEQHPDDFTPAHFQEMEDALGRIREKAETRKTDFFDHLMMEAIP